MNRSACLRLTDRCATILISIHEDVAEARQEVGEVLRGPIARLVAAFDRIHGVVRKQFEGPFLKRYIQRKDHQGELSECHNDLCDALAMFSLAMQVRILHQVVRSPQPVLSDAGLPNGLSSASVASTKVLRSGGERPTDGEDILAQLEAVTARQLTSDFARDTADLRRLLQDALRAPNDVEMLQILQVGKNEMPEAIVALQRALGGGRDAEADPLVTSHQNVDDEDASVVASERPDRRDTPSTAAIVDSMAGLPDEVEKEFMVAGISALKRMSANVVLPSWTITRFELDKGKPIGAGGWANVYEGKWNGRVVAIKELAAPTARELFQQEVSIWRSLQHSNVLPLYGASATESDPPWYLVSPYLRHGTLVSYLRNLPSLEDADVLKFVHQIAKGMTFLHHKEVLHGDLKGVNVLVNDKLQCVISDFGQSEMKLEVSRITGRSLSLGTLRWKAPELLSGEGALSTATDVYAFAVTVVEILGKGKIPWGACDDTSVQSRVLRERPSIEPAWQSQWLTPLIGIVNKCWQQDPTNRPNFSEVDHEVQELRAQAKHGFAAPPLASGPSLPDTKTLRARGSISTLRSSSPQPSAPPATNFLPTPDPPHVPSPNLSHAPSPNPSHAPSRGPRRSPSIPHAPSAASSRSGRGLLYYLTCGCVRG
ncbi:kinase-like protein [Trametes sanguinea]|nr:kinase-like protein [Trametes sanguinea]